MHHDEDDQFSCNINHLLPTFSFWDYQLLKNLPCTTCPSSLAQKKKKKLPLHPLLPSKIHTKVTHPKPNNKIVSKSFDNLMSISRSLPLMSISLIFFRKPHFFILTKWFNRLSRYWHQIFIFLKISKRLPFQSFVLPFSIYSFLTNSRDLMKSTLTHYPKEVCSKKPFMSFHECWQETKPIIN